MRVNWSWFGDESWGLNLKTPTPSLRQAAFLIDLRTNTAHISEVGALGLCVSGFEMGFRVLGFALGVCRC